MVRREREREGERGKITYHITTYMVGKEKNKN
jgi:hypothetical protein